MKNKFNKSNSKAIRVLSIINLFVVFMLMNSCYRQQNGMQNSKSENGLEVGQGQKEAKQIIDKCCPICRGGDRYLYKLDTSNQNDIVLMCEECSSVWLSPKETGSENAASDQHLMNYFSVKEEIADKIFAEGNSWATEKQVCRNETWKNLEDKSLLVKVIK